MRNNQCLHDIVYELAKQESFEDIPEHTLVNCLKCNTTKILTDHYELINNYKLVTQKKIIHKLYKQKQYNIYKKTGE